MQSGGTGLTFAKIVKSVNQVQNNNNVLVDDDDLIVSLDSNKTYTFIAFLFCDSEQEQLKYNFRYPSGADGAYVWSAWHGFEVGQLRSTQLSSISLTAERSLRVSGRIITDSTPGTFALQWAQTNASATDIRMLKGSMLVVWEQ